MAEMKLTQADRIALSKRDDKYINAKGAKLYAEERYAEAIEYYRLAASMGNADSYSNLGYCYMYGRSIPKNMSIALEYFKLSADRDNPDALYKLGSIYRNGADGVEIDNELAAYYYLRARDAIEDGFDINETDYPNLYHSLAKEVMPGGMFFCEPATAYKYLTIARKGYEKEAIAGIRYHKKQYEEVLQLLDLPIFDDYKEEDEDDLEF